MDERECIFIMNNNFINILTKELEVSLRLDASNLHLSPNARFTGMSCGYGKLQVTFSYGGQIGVAAFRLLYGTDDDDWE